MGVYMDYIDGDNEDDDLMDDIDEEKNEES